MKIQVAGPGCANCQNTEKNVINACAELNLAADIEHVTDWVEIAKLGVMRTPAVVVDGKVLVTGRVATVAERKKLFSGMAG